MAALHDGPRRSWHRRVRSRVISFERYKHTIRERRQYWVTTDGGRFRIDLAYPEHMIAVEIDGAQHEDRDVTSADRRRTALLETALAMRSGVRS